MKLLVFDGNSIINRAFYGIRLLTNQTGLYTNAIYGFLNIYSKFIGEEAPDFVCVAFDRPEPTFRHSQYEGYKAKRHGMPEELAQQIPLLKEVLSAMNVCQLELAGFEADDIIGTLCDLCEGEGCQCVIVTGDRDDLQLIGEHTRVLLTATKGGKPVTHCMDRAAFFDQYGLDPAQMTDVKALMGDPSDNIPGVAGIGEKTALSLIQEYGSVDKLYEAIDRGIFSGKEGVKNKLLTGRETAYLSLRLAAICKTVPLPFTLSDAAMKPFNQPKLDEMLRFLDIKSLRLASPLSEAPPEQKDEPADTPCYFPFDEQPVSAAEFALGGSFPFLWSADTVWFSWKDRPYALSLDNPACITFLKEVIENPAVKKYTHDVKGAATLLNRFGICFEEAAFDTLLGAYVLDPSVSIYYLNDLKEKYIEGYSPSSNTPLELMALSWAMEQRLAENGQTELYYKMELPLAFVLASMEQEGFKVDREALVRFGYELDEKIDLCSEAIYNLAGERDFNIASTRQLGVILFEKLGLPVIKKNKTGYSTDVDVLKKLEPYHEIIPLILDHRQMTKLKSTYVTGLLAVLDPNTGKIHSTFRQTITQTGRLSSTEPNLQNIPIRQELGREIRRAFIPSGPGHILIDADYSQIELRVLAHISGDKAMQKAFLENMDIHTATAAQVFHVPPEAVTGEMRRRAKAVNFGIVYGIGDFSLADDLKITRKEAKDYIENYLFTYHGVKEYMENTVKEAKEKGYVTTLFGRRRYIPELKNSNHNVRAFGERCAMNTPIQGSAADIIKVAMVRVYNRLKEENLSARLLLQVHDELIVDAPEREADRVAALLQEEMEGAIRLDVPLTVDLHRGENWYLAKG
jgi:DNA polymerase-1